MSEAVVKKEASVSSVSKDKQHPMSLKTVYLHSAIIIDGRTESTIMKEKVPNLLKLEWLPSGFLLIQTNRSTHVLPSAAVKDSLLV